MSMVRRRDEMTIEFKKMFGGSGEAENRCILLGPEEMEGRGRVFRHLVLQPGCEVGWHIHHGDAETYYFLRGRGEYNDNGTLTEVGPGDTTHVGPEEGHSLRAVGDEPLEAVALILYAD